MFRKTIAEQESEITNNKEIKVGDYVEPKNITYNEFDDIDLNYEIERINNAEIINIRIDTKNKGLLFLLGMLFAAGKRINIINKHELDFSDESYFKSYAKMTYTWEKFGDPNFGFNNANSELEKRIADAKRLRIEIKPINNCENQNHIFLICPVRNASERQREDMELYKNIMLEAGYKVHIPHLDTEEEFDLFGGYAICCENGDAIAKADAVHIYYDKESQGSLFDLGIAYYLNKSLVLINQEQIAFDENDFGDRLVKKWVNPVKGMPKRLTK